MLAALGVQRRCRRQGARCADAARAAARSRSCRSRSSSRVAGPRGSTWARPSRRTRSSSAVSAGPPASPWPSPSRRSSGSRRRRSTARSPRTRRRRCRSRRTWRSRSSRCCSPLTTFAVVTALGASQAVDEAAHALRAGRRAARRLRAGASSRSPTSTSAAGCPTLMSWLVLSSLFAGLLAFQNSAARYFFSMGRAGVLPTPAGPRQQARRAADRLDRDLGDHRHRDRAVRRDRTRTRSSTCSSGSAALAVVAIVLVEFLVCIAVMAFFRRQPDEARPLEDHDRADPGGDRPGGRRVPPDVPLRPAGGHRGEGRRPDGAVVGPEHSRATRWCSCRSRCSSSATIVGVAPSRGENAAAVSDLVG